MKATEHVVFLSHPVAGDVRGNLARFEAWFRLLYREHPDTCLCAPWYLYVRSFGDDGPLGPYRRRGLADNLGVVVRSAEVWGVGLKFGQALTDGMFQEFEKAAEVGIPRKVLRSQDGYPRAPIIATRSWEPQEWSEERKFRTP